MFGDLSSTPSNLICFLDVLVIEMVCSKLFLLFQEDSFPLNEISFLEEEYFRTLIDIECTCDHKSSSNCDFCVEIDLEYLDYLGYL